MKPTSILAPLTLALLGACGGGGGAGLPTFLLDQATAQAMSANSAVIPGEGGAAVAVLLTTLVTIVAGGHVSETFACAGGGTAVFSITGGTLAGLINGLLDPGEIYRVTFNDCRAVAGGASVSGTVTVGVLGIDASSIEITTSTPGLSVALPQRTLSWSGESNFSRSVATSGAASLTSERWTAARLSLTSLRGTRSSHYTLHDLDLARSLTASAGVVTARSSHGTHTMAAELPGGASWRVTTATLGDVLYDANGVPTQGAWTITLPDDRLAVGVVPGTVTVTLDRGSDGTIDRTWVFGSGVLADEAG